MSEEVNNMSLTKTTAVEVVRGFYADNEEMVYEELDFKLVQSKDMVFVKSEGCLLSLNALKVLQKELEHFERQVNTK